MGSVAAWLDHLGMTNYHIGLHRITSHQIWLNWRRLHQPRTACIAVVNHALAPCLYLYDVRGKPFIRQSKVLREFPTRLQRPVCRELYCYTDCWRHVCNRWPRPNTAFGVA